ncbi:hypothetical protein PHBOTO_001416 [Pseudozyma hubeiensis]|nr:hypothetical protein PHBOTO_001416 [Pseudozyma hubeiensis]
MSVAQTLIVVVIVSFQLLCHLADLSAPAHTRVVSRFIRRRVVSDPFGSMAPLAVSAYYDVEDDMSCDKFT